ncbi:DUF3019 domain-containing protein [Thalassotalea profundi]|uniref:DUF3019 domain-containing protein n=1 Tax=Thalassotalea profundi TaxID=2036687 RepID=A0ABQ3IKB8_9GAMM|nr:DUF3019 domain-containing protein [Thalassotalea profundi]GHE86427.1 hypothetical protein GCM10011501_14510 [Thalassotalea profundi]
MRSNNWFRYSLVYFPIQCFSVSAFASQPQAILEITPKICIVEKSGDPCSMEINVSWQSPTISNYCLYQEELAIKCWKNTRHVNTNIPITLQKNNIFTLRNDSQIFAAKTIRVSGVSPQRYRRKLRADWSVF